MWSLIGFQVIILGMKWIRKRITLLRKTVYRVQRVLFSLFICSSINKDNLLVWNCIAFSIRTSCLINDLREEFPYNLPLTTKPTFNRYQVWSTSIRYAVNCCQCSSKPILTGYFPLGVFPRFSGNNAYTERWVSKTPKKHSLYTLVVKQALSFWDDCQ